MSRARRRPAPQPKGTCASASTVPGPVVSLSNAGPDGIRFNQAVVGRALQTYLGVSDRDPQPLRYDLARAQEVAGHYDNDAAPSGSDAPVTFTWKGKSMTKRLTGPPPHSQDPYAKLTSPRGIPVDQLVSVLQKEIRRSNVDNAVLAAYEMLSTSADVAEHLWRRLKLIAVEDVGMGEPLAPLLLNCLHENFRAIPGAGTMMAVHAVRLLATARKDRTSSEHADLVAAKVERGELVVSVPDYALCVHTRAGQEMGRGLTQWWEDGALVNDELDTADHSYRDELIEIHRAAENDGIT